jgi:protoheme IX farnesyltransferase
MTPPPSTAAAPVAVSPARPRALQVVADLFTLTKPRVQSLLLLTTISAMMVAGYPSVGLVLVTLFGGALSAGGAGAVNHWYDRDIDLQMARTADRPIAAGRIAPWVGLTYGLVLAGASLLVLGFGANWLAAGISFFGFLWYAVLYTMVLKRRTPQNIVWGGAAGAVPPMVGWAAVTGSVTWTSFALFLIVFCWTPPHFWALSLLMKDEYAKVNVPMLPVVRGERVTRNWILGSTVVLVASTLLPYITYDFNGRYLSSVLILGAGFLWGAVRLQRDPSRKAALQLYLYSLLYLALVFGAMVCDQRL